MASAGRLSSVPAGVRCRRRVTCAREEHSVLLRRGRRDHRAPHPGARRRQRRPRPATPRGEDRPGRAPRRTEGHLQPAGRAPAPPRGNGPPASRQAEGSASPAGRRFVANRPPMAIRSTLTGRWSDWRLSVARPFSRAGRCGPPVRSLPFHPSSSGPAPHGPSWMPPAAAVVEPASGRLRWRVTKLVSPPPRRASGTPAAQVRRGGAAHGDRRRPRQRPAPQRMRRAGPRQLPLAQRQRVCTGTPRPSVVWRHHPVWVVSSAANVVSTGWPAALGAASSRCAAFSTWHQAVGGACQPVGSGGSLVIVVAVMGLIRSLGCVGVGEQHHGSGVLTLTRFESQALVLARRLGLAVDLQQHPQVQAATDP